MARVDVGDGFVSKAILTEIESMSPTSQFPTSVHIGYFESTFGGVSKWDRLAPTSEQASLWVGKRCDRPLGVLKLYPSPDGANRERNAYREWAAQLPQWTASFHGSPRQDPGALVLGYVEGDSATFGASPDVFEAAGRFAAAFHGLPHDDLDSLPLREAVSRRAKASRNRGGSMTSTVHDTVERLILRGDFGRRVPSHRDFAPWNWQVSQGRLTVLDFGQSRPDTWLMDLVKLVVFWTPAQSEAFFSGYGRTLSIEEEWALMGLVGLHGVGSLQWGQRHDQTRPVVEGEHSLRWFEKACEHHGVG